ncbi:MAG: hypothetical protein F4Y73_17640, partial [Gemmatimonadetes bacterium]|nr:hypothetical protein [Gemmatimonadota bacterium]
MRKDQEDHLGRVGHPTRQRDDRLEEADRARLDLVVGARHHHATPRRLVVAPLVLARRQEVAPHRREDHAGREEDERVRNREAPLACRQGGGVGR